MLFETRYGPLAIAHNGNFVNESAIREHLVNDGAIFQSNSDTETFVHTLNRSNKETLEDAIVYATEQIPTAYSLLIMTPEKVIALKDRFGVRPLSFANLGHGYLISSEDYAFSQFKEAEFIREISSGEMVVFDKSGNYTEIQYTEPDEHFCVFEQMYFSNPMSKKNGFRHRYFRELLGKILHEENPDLDMDTIIPILDSGKFAALGYSKASGITYNESFLRVHDPPGINTRSFTSPTYEERIKTAYQKLILADELVNGKRVATMDDSIVRGTTMRIINERLRNAGATYITNVVAAPPIVNTCPLGMDYNTKEELVAYGKTLDEITRQIGADKLIYISLEGVYKAVTKTTNSGICSGCFGGNYPHK